MDRKHFIEMITSQYFTMEEGKNIPDKKYEDFPIEKTQMFTELKSDPSREALCHYLNEEKKRDNWRFLTEEFSGCLIQMLSTNPAIEDANLIEIDQIEALYYKMLEGLTGVASMESYCEESAKVPYMEHMEDLRVFFMSFMDLKKFNGDMI